MKRTKSNFFGILILFLVALFSYCSKPQPLIILMTDFGEKDFYLGAIKGAIYSVNPQARLDYISNFISKFNIAEGAYTLFESAVEFPAGTVFVVVIDPGVGMERKPIAVKTKDGKIFIGPDNGVFSLVIDELGLDAVYEITNPEVMRKQKMSTTFHGRDIFAPAAAHLSRGFAVEQFGPQITDFVHLTFDKAKILGDKILGSIVIIDDYGNAITNIPKSLFEILGWSLGDSLEVKAGDHEFAIKFVKAYGEVPKAAYLGLFGSGGVFEVAINQGNLAQNLGLKSGDIIRIRKLHSIR